ncbi:MAG: hypothetical protein M3O26_10755 [Pseudomonadota bacterium]|nr:hypothetical protein [Pseudomonadota bacterium]
MTYYADQFPMTPLGGIFLIGAGLGVILGAVFPRRRMISVWFGFAVGGICIFLLGGFIAKGLPAATIFQLGFLIAAILTEFIAFATLMPRARLQGERVQLTVTMFIVGGHFLIMVPAFGLIIACLAVCCIANASASKWVASYPVSRAWLIDGCLKSAFGLLMLLTAPAFRVHTF